MLNPFKEISYLFLFVKKCILIKQKLEIIMFPINYIYFMLLYFPSEIYEIKTWFITSTTNFEELTFHYTATVEYPV